MKSLLGLCTALVLVGCVTTQVPQGTSEEMEAERRIQRNLAFDNLMSNQRRLDVITWPLLTQNAAGLCQLEQTKDLGWRVGSRSQYEEHYHDAAESQLGLDDGLTVLWARHSLAGDLQPGDKILAINDDKLAAGKNGLEQYQTLLAAANDEVVLTLRRGSQDLRQSVSVWPVCKYPISVVLDAAPNAYATGSMVAVHTGLLRLFDRDKDVAVVVGHEIAHNLKKHVQKGMVPVVLGIALDTVLGTEGVGAAVATKFSPGLEAEADYVGLYLTAVAGVDISEAPTVWRRFAVEFEATTEKSFLSSHPPTPERFVSLKKTVAEIQSKQARNAPLVPDRR